jgi:hypothetical protein
MGNPAHERGFSLIPGWAYSSDAMKPAGIFRALSIAFGLVVIAAPGARAQSTSAADAPSLLVPKARRDPYRNLFQRRAIDPTLTRQQPEPADKKPEFSCHIVVIPADPRVDPRIVLPAPRDNDTHYTMRIIEPPCTAAERR